MTDAKVAEAIARAAILGRQGRANEGLVALQGAVVGGSPLEASALLVRAELLDALLEHAEATPLLADLLDRFPSDPAVLLRAGLRAYRSGDLARAETLLRRSWHLARSPEAGYYLSRMDLAAGHAGRALETVAVVITAEAPAGYWRQQAEELARSALREQEG